MKSLIVHMCEEAESVELVLQYVIDWPSMRIASYCD